MTHPDLNKYERAGLIGKRADMIAAGAPILIPLADETDALVIATKEFHAGKLNTMQLVRTAPNQHPISVPLGNLRKSLVVQYNTPQK